MNKKRQKLNQAIQSKSNLVSTYFGLFSANFSPSE